MNLELLIGSELDIVKLPVAGAGVLDFECCDGLCPLVLRTAELNGGNLDSGSSIPTGDRDRRLVQADGNHQVAGAVDVEVLARSDEGSLAHLAVQPETLAFSLTTIPVAFAVDELELHAFLSTIDGVNEGGVVLVHHDLAIGPSGIGERASDVKGILEYGSLRPGAGDDELVVLDVGTEGPLAGGQLDGVALSLKCDFFAQELLGHNKVAVAHGTNQIVVEVAPFFGFLKLGGKLDEAFIGQRNRAAEELGVLVVGQFLACVGLPVLEIADNIERGFLGGGFGPTGDGELLVGTDGERKVTAATHLEVAAVVTLGKVDVGAPVFVHAIVAFVSSGVTAVPLVVLVDELELGTILDTWNRNRETAVIAFSQRLLAIGPSGISERAGNKPGGFSGSGLFHHALHSSSIVVAAVHPVEVASSEAVVTVVADNEVARG